MLRSILLALVVLGLLYGPRLVWRRPATGLLTPPSGPAGDDPDWNDLPFHIREVSKPSPEGRRLVLDATYGPKIALTVSLGSSWKEGHLGDTQIRTFQGSVTIAPLSPSGESFAADLDKRYGTSLKPRSTKAATFTAISLEGAPGDLDAGPVKIKLFFEPDGDEDNYAEAFLNINLATSEAEFAEKDQDYRKNLVKAFSKP